MNQIRFRDTISDLFKTYPKLFGQFLTPSLQDKWLKAPLFVTDGEAPRDFDQTVQPDLMDTMWSDDLTLRLPFPTMKLRCLEVDFGTLDTEKRPETLHVMQAGPSRLDLLTIVPVTESISDIAKGQLMVSLRRYGFLPKDGVKDDPNRDYINHEGTHRVIKTAVRWCITDCVVLLHPSREIMFASSLGQKAAAGRLATKHGMNVIHEDSSNYLQYLQYLSYRVAYPDGYVVKVSPGRATKSVQWNEERTHYTVIPGDAIRSMQKGSTREATNEVIRRCAGERRAHWRRLEHPKFKRNPDGSVRTIWIRDSWVGPVEWRNKYDDHVYSMVDIEPPNIDLPDNIV